MTRTCAMQMSEPSFSERSTASSVPACWAATKYVKVLFQLPPDEATPTVRATRPPVLRSVTWNMCSKRPCSVPEAFAVPAPTVWLPIVRQAPYGADVNTAPGTGGRAFQRSKTSRSGACTTS